ncbi:MAG: coproporphyrinogen dehydrogenase HemZ [Clostridia bacterium]|nr:coproporphyrinogen dehydrogenase HemZ [Clostridia bacterium]
MELVRAFHERTDKDFSLHLEYDFDGDRMSVSLKLDGDITKEYNSQFTIVYNGDMERKRLEKRYLKEAIYNAIVDYTGVKLPYGCLTGIRPTKLFRELGDKARVMFENDFSVSEKKVDLVEKIVKVQEPVRNDGDGFDVFVFIPFCPTRCTYCSFVSVPIDKQKKLIEPYVECLLKEIEFIKEVVTTKNLKIRTVYVGGGTPTSIPIDLLDKILGSLEWFKPFEFTVEAGRPDTINFDILTMLKSHGVTRISINPQTFNDKTLALIGRKHTTALVEEVYAMAKDMFSVNMDLIACLPGETLDDFKHSVDKAIELDPDNITVHTLYLKKGSALKVGGYQSSDNDSSEKMVDYACDELMKAGYEPYYMYRQKYTSANLENVGYAKPKTLCVYNVDIMEEDTSILAMGAAAISKKWSKDLNLIERNANYKEPLEYVKHFDTVLEKQRKFWLE